MRILLNGEWEFKEKNDEKWLDARVPGCNFLDLMACGLIADPFVGTNEKDLAWVGERDWQYRKNFMLTKDTLDADKVFLVCAMLDTIADIMINGNIIASANNCHTEFRQDIKNCLVVGENTIEILFYSPVKYVLERQAKEKCPSNANGLDGIPHIRKPQCHFGWDWGPTLTPSGISGDIYLEPAKVANFENVEIKQKHTDGLVTLNVVAQINNFFNKSLTAVVEVKSPSGDVIIKTVDIASSIDCEIVIINPELWWTAELSEGKEQALYNVNITIFDGKTPLEKDCRKIGLRTITLNQEKDEFGQNFQFILNGVAIFAKGANWIPADSFITRADYDTIEFYIKSARECNFNMLRVWGGGYYESDNFYDLCDKYGILVWQDFAFACQPYPFFDEQFRNNVAREVECNIKRLRHHASLCLWCGNNEIELMSIAWITRKKYVDWTEKYFYEYLPKIVASFDNATPYIAGTPIGSSHNKGVASDNIGDTHLWAVWHGLQGMKYYRKRPTRFCSEFGFESLPDIKCIRTFAEEKDYSLTSEIFKAHQKCNSGNMKMAYYIASRFRLPKDFKDYIYLSQICQQECIADASEHWRRRKGRCNGSLFWQFNDCWPVCSWASIDYMKNYKALQYSSKKFFAPRSLSIEDTKNSIKIFALNDTLENVEGTALIRLIDFDGDCFFETSFDVAALQNSSACVYEIAMNTLKKSLKNPKNVLIKGDIKTSARRIENCVFVAEWKVGEQIISRKTLLFDAEKNIKLPRANVGISVEIKGNTAYYTLMSHKFLRLASVSSDMQNSNFSDNYFDLLPNEEMIISQKLSKKCSTSELKDALSIFSVSDVVAGGSRFSDFALRAKVFLIPINFFSWIYYKGLV